VTQADIITRVQERLDEDATTSQRYTTADLTEYTLDGARAYIAFAGSQYSRVTITAEADTLFYELPCDFIQVERVLWNSDGTYIPIEPTQFSTLDDEVYQWQRQTAPHSTHYFRFSSRELALWPMPTEDGEEYIVHYQQDVYDDLSAVAVEDHECIVDYVLARSLLAEGKVKDGAERYAAYSACVQAAKRRRNNLDKTWSMGSMR
tara:strand:+ start:247 stop:861 length:615 start_codon:yes stop_codon:yes gene_type:complete